MGQIDIRRMTEGDLDQVSAIERDLFSLPWSRTSFLFEVNDSKTSVPITASEDGEVAGYAVAWFVADELHIGNVAVVRHRQATGIGKALLDSVEILEKSRGLAVKTDKVLMKKGTYPKF